MKVSHTFYIAPNHRPQPGPSLTELQVKHRAKATQNQQFSQVYIYATKLILTNKNKWLNLKVLTCHLWPADYTRHSCLNISILQTSVSGYYTSTPKHLSWTVHDRAHSKDSLPGHSAGPGGTSQDRFSAQIKKACRHQSSCLDSTEQTM